MMDTLKRKIIESVNYAYAEGIDKPEITGWTWPRAKMVDLDRRCCADCIPETGWQRETWFGFEIACAG